MAGKQQTYINIDTLETVMDHIITNNRYIQAKGGIPKALEIVGDSGIGKTSKILQVAKKHNLPCVKVNLAMIEELGDLVGFPIRQFEVCKGEVDDGYICQWIDEHAVDEFRHLGYRTTGLNRMSYCPPEWIAGKEKGGILLLDDWNRADTRFIQATMELLDRQTYISWKLPEDWHIILSANPDNGEYSVNSLDDAQKTRFTSLNLKFDMDTWARWAEEAGIDGRCINFLLMHPELVTKNVNARSITTFFENISSFTTFETNLPMIQILGEGSVGQEFASLFTLFINNRLDKLISPQEILFGKDEANIIGRLKHCIGVNNNYRGDIASTLAMRIINYSLHYCKENTIDKILIERIQNLIVEDIFVNDLRYNIVKSIFNGDKVKFRTLILNAKVAKYILG